MFVVVKFVIKRVKSVEVMNEDGQTHRARKKNEKYRSRGIGSEKERSNI